jgi:DNA adenine methylase
MGGAALFFHVAPHEAYLADTNPELVGCYKVVRDNVEGLIKELGSHRYDEEYYYSVREWDRKEDFSSLPCVVRAARFIYLNKTCFNGLYRVNSKGYFNVPFGRYSNPKIVDADNLRECSRALARAEIVVSDYAAIVDHVEKGDFVYFDPPYAPLSVTSSFTAYTKQGFDSSDQEALREVCYRLDKKGVFFMLSNSSTPEMLELYKDFTITSVLASRAINSKASDRGPVSEIIVTNY